MCGVPLCKAGVVQAQRAILRDVELVLNPLWFGSEIASESTTCGVLTQRASAGDGSNGGEVTLF
jgi:hypothetical protein